MHNQVKELVDKEMSRKDFLKFMAGGALVLFGVNNLLSYFLQSKSPSSQNLPTSHGFGSRKFGG